MSAAVLEIVELPTGEVVLRHAGSDGAVLVTLQFSAESREFLGESRVLVAKAMFRAGILAAVEQAGGEVELDFIGGSDDTPRLLH